MVVNDDTTFVCSFCNKRFPSEAELKNHVVLVHGNVSKVSRIGSFTMSETMKTGMIVLAIIAAFVMVPRYLRRKR